MRGTDIAIALPIEPNQLCFSRGAILKVGSLRLGFNITEKIGKDISCLPAKKLEIKSLATE
ncbi:MAG TPA: hypothetical protein VK203_17585 [Nostocaceae cyanobacterium]|nr:hypothetical protein [Nostocaceae cyanobacterium]